MENIMYTIPSWYVLLPLFILGVIALIKWSIERQKRNKPVSSLQVAVLFTFGIYLLCVIHLVFFPIDVNIGEYANQTEWYKTINFIPILTIDIRTFLLNIIMLIPLGMYIPLLKQHYGSVYQIAKIGLTISLSFELVQLIIRITLGSGRTTDINDLLANTAGTVIGFVMMKKLMRISWIKSLFKHFQL